MIILGVSPSSCLAAARQEEGAGLFAISFFCLRIFRGKKKDAAAIPSRNQPLQTPEN